MIFFWMLAPTLVVFALLRAPRAATALRRLARRTGLVAPPARPTAWPIERIAADLRRLNRRLDALRTAGPAPGKGVRWKAAQMAYEDRLADACQALGVDHRLTSARPHVAERRRVEAALADAGLDVRPWDQAA